MIPIEHWKWRGLKGHFILSEKCRFGLCTDIGKYRISTVGALYYEEDRHMREMGSNRHYETFVFVLSDKEKVESFCEIDSAGLFFNKDQDDPYKKDAEAEEMHMRMCEKYAVIGFSEWMERQ